VRNERSPRTTGGPATTSAPFTIPNPAEEAWVIRERQRIGEAREARLVSRMALGLRGRRHDDHPNVWSTDRVRRLEQRRRTGAA
jgi:hypothetical protein